MNEFSLSPQPLQLRQTEAGLLRCNDLTRRYGLCLSSADAVRLAQRRFESLRATGRVEFGEGVLEPLIRAFCDSPDIQQAEYADTLDALQSIFYARKQDAMERLSDGELIAALRLIFDRVHGSLEALGDVDVATLCKIARSGSLSGTALAEEFDDE